MGDAHKATQGSFAKYSRLSCEPGLAPSGGRLKRLNYVEYENSIRDILARAGQSGLFSSLQSTIRLIPTDAVGQFLNFDDSISQNHINGFYQVARQISEAVASDNNTLNGFRQGFSNCSSDADNCLRQFISDFGLWTFRRPLTSTEVDRYLGGITSSGGQRFADVIFVFLQSPQFLFHLEIEGTAIAGDSVLRLSAYELVSRLSFAFWRSMPDQTLFNMASNNSVLSDQGLQNAIDHIFNSSNEAKVKASFQEFYRDWFRFDVLGTFEFVPSNTVFDAFLDGMQAPTMDAMTAEIDAMMDYYTWQTDGSMTDILLSQRSFAREPALAAVYGVQEWNGNYSHDVQLPLNERSGLLTRSYFLVSPDEETHPILRSVAIRREILCDQIPDPPSNLPPDALTPPAKDPTRTTRERFEVKTESRTCQGCHSFINPVGFAFEAYDSLGRYRHEEKIFADDGSFVSRPVDSEVIPNLQSSDEAPVSGPIELNRIIAGSSLVDQCFARQFWRFVNKRMEERGDHCAIEHVAAPLTAGNGSIKQAIKRIVNTPGFKRRYVNP